MRLVDAQLILSLYDSIIKSAPLEPAVTAMARRFGCGSASIVSFDPLLPQASAALGIGAFDEAAKRRYDAELAPHDPAPAIFAAHPSGTVFASNRLFPADYLKRSLFLHEFLLPMGIEETLGGTIAARDGRLAMLTIHRGPDRAPFDDDEMAGLELLLPHVSRALELRRAFARLKTNAPVFMDRRTPDELRLKALRRLWKLLPPAEVAENAPI